MESLELPVVRDFSYKSLRMMEYDRSQRWSSFFSYLENIKDEEEIPIDRLDDVIGNSVDEENLNSSQWEEAEECEEEDMTLEQLDILLDITNHKHSNDLASPMASFVSNLEDTIDNNDLVDTINQTLPIVEEHIRKSKETGIDNILNTFDAKVIKEKVGRLIHPKNESKINTNCKRATKNKLQEYKVEKNVKKYQDDSSSDADSMHSMETARYVLSSRKKRLAANAFKEKTTIKSYCKLKSRRDLLHQKYAIEEEEPNCIEPHHLSTSPDIVCTKATAASNVNHLTQSERRPKLFRKRRSNGITDESDDKKSLNHLKTLQNKQKVQLENPKQKNKISKKCILKKKNGKNAVKIKKHTKDLILSNNNNETLECELQRAIELSKKTYEDEMKRQCVQSTEIELQMFPNVQTTDNKPTMVDNDIIDTNDDDSFEKILRPQPKSKKLSKLLKMRNKECSLVASEKTFFANAANVCNSTAIGHNITAANREVLLKDSTTPIKTPNVKETPVKGAQQLISAPLPLLEKQKKDENDCNLVTSTSDENQNHNKKHILLYTPKDKKLILSKLSPNSRNSGYIKITQEHLRPVMGETKARKFFKYHVGRRCFDINSTIYYCPPEDETISTTENTDSEDDELENFGRYGDLHETK